MAKDDAVATASTAEPPAPHNAWRPVASPSQSQLMVPRTAAADSRYSPLLLGSRAVSRHRTHVTLVQVANRRPKMGVTARKCAAHAAASEHGGDDVWRERSRSADHPDHRLAPRSGRLSSRPTLSLSGLKMPRKTATHNVVSRRGGCAARAACEAFSSLKLLLTGEAPEASDDDQPALKGDRAVEHDATPLGLTLQSLCARPCKPHSRPASNAQSGRPFA